MTHPFDGPAGSLRSWSIFPGTLLLAMLVSFAGRRNDRRPRLLYGLVFLCLLSVGATMSACVRVSAIPAIALMAPARSPERFGARDAVSALSRCACDSAVEEVEAVAGVERRQEPTI